MNAAKECWELPHYTYEEHFKKPVPSFPPRAVMLDYLKGRWNKEGVRKLVKFNTAVKEVVYNKVTDNFTVTIHGEELKKEVFDYVVVATGHFSTPHIPKFPGVEKFTGRVLHAHDYR